MQNMIDIQMKLNEKVRGIYKFLYPAFGVKGITCLCCIALFCLIPAKVFSANFSINPVRIFLDGAQKTNILKIRNQSDEKVSLQLKTYTWTHDSKGENTYTPTKDIIFFPRIVTIHKDEEKIIRIGTTMPQGDQEKTYRLFIEEIPSPDPVKSNVVKMVMKVGVPIFIAPVKTEEKGSIESVQLQAGTLHLKVKNRGNAHFIVNSIEVSGEDSAGKEIYQTEIGGWYLHSGKIKEYSVEIPEDLCDHIATVRVDLSTDNKISFSEILNVTKEQCLP